MSHVLLSDCLDWSNFKVDIAPRKTSLKNDVLRQCYPVVRQQTQSSKVWVLYLILPLTM